MVFIKPFVVRPQLEEVEILHEMIIRQYGLVKLRYRSQQPFDRIRALITELRHFLSKRIETLLSLQLLSLFIPLDQAPLLLNDEMSLCFGLVDTP